MEPRPGTEDRVAALYIRVSTRKQEENWSVKDQRTLARLGHERGLAVAPYEEQGKSGETIEERPKMQQLLADIEAGRIAAVIAVDWNRLSRDEDIIDGLRIKKACKDNDVLVLTPNRVYDFTTETDGFLAELELMFAASQKQKIVKATTRGQYAKARAGGWLGGHAPFGFAIVYDVPHPDGRPRGRLVINEREAEIIRLIFRLYADGLRDARGHVRPMSYKAIALHLNALGHTIPVRQSNRRRDGTAYKRGAPRPFVPQDVRRILDQRMYLGFFTWGEGQLSRYVRDEGPVEVHIPDLQIVDVGLWQRAHSVRRERSTGPRRTACSPHPLTGLLRCPHCDSLLGTNRCGADAEAQYGCYRARHFGRAACPGFWVLERVARPAVEALLLEHLLRLPLDRLLTQERDAMAQEAEGAVAQDVLVKLQETEAALNRLVRAVASGTFTPAEARNVKLELMEKKERLQTRLNKLQARAHVRQELLEALEQIQDLPAAVSKLDGARFRRLARLLFDHVVLTSERTGRTRTAQVLSHRHPEAYTELVRTFETLATASGMK